MKKLLIIFLFLPMIVQGQTATDYEIYSTLIRDDRAREGFNPPNFYIVLEDSIPILMTEDIISLLDNKVWKDSSNISLGTESDTPKYFEIECLLKKALKDAESLREFKLKADNFKIETPIRIMTPENRAALEKADEYWTRFNKLYPNSLGLYRFSHVSYYGRLAIAHIDCGTGWLSGSGSLMIMIKRGGKWEPFFPLMTTMR